MAKRCSHSCKKHCGKSSKSRRSRSRSRGRGRGRGRGRTQRHQGGAMSALSPQDI
jgi:hypothetical protein